MNIQTVLNLLLFSLFILIATPGIAASSTVHQQSPAPRLNTENGQTSKVQKAHFSEKKERKHQKWKERLSQWSHKLAMNLPTGKVLGSLIFLVLGIVFFAIAGVTIYGTLFGILGSAAVVVAVLLFVLWMIERSKNTPASLSD